MRSPADDRVRTRASMVAAVAALAFGLLAACSPRDTGERFDSAAGAIGDSAHAVSGVADSGGLSGADSGSMAGMSGMDSLHGMAGADSASATSAPAGMSPDQQAVIDELGALGGKPIETLAPAEARKQPTPTDAVFALLKKQNRSTTPEAVGNIADRTIPGPGGAIPVRIYTPVGTGPFPVVVYYHGGGFVIATNDTYDGSARALTNATNAVLISVEYRKAPEHKFPAAHDDAYAAYLWARKNASSIKGDSARIALAGESAGGNLAIATALMARDRKITLPAHILAVYPIAGVDTSTSSYRENANARPLNRAMMAWFLKQYTKSPADLKSGRLDLLNADLKGLPPVTIITAQIDPLRSDGELLASRLRDAGVSVDIRNFSGVAHEFFGQGAVVPTAKEAVQFGATGLKSGFTM